MQISEIAKKFAYAVIFGFMGLIIGIWTADLLYGLIMKNIERTAAISLSLMIIILITAGASLIGFTKGKKLLE